MTMKKTFAIYCSGGASRVIKFYSFNSNKSKYKPKKIIYDGNKTEVILKLNKLFKGDIVLFNRQLLSYKEPNKIYKTTSEFIHRVLCEHNIDYTLCFGDKILKKELIGDYKERLINFHPALLPSFKGLYAIDKALEDNVSFIGNTAHFIDEGIDTGEIILQTVMLKEEFENYEDVLELQFPMIKMILRDFLHYEISDNEIFSEITNRKKKYLIPKKCVK